MDSMELEVYRAAMTWLAGGCRVLMATVVATWGSSPRPVGSLFAVATDGRSVGSVSGGCIEDDIIDKMVSSGMTGHYPRTVQYGVGADEAHRFGLPCGGTIKLVMEELRDSALLGEMVKSLAARRSISRRLNMRTGALRIAPAERDGGLSFDGTTLLTFHGPTYRLLLIGAGQLSSYVSAMAQGVGFSVTVCDPRDVYYDQWQAPDVPLVRTMPDDTVIDMGLDCRSAVLALSHDPGDHRL